MIEEMHISNDLCDHMLSTMTDKEIIKAAEIIKSRSAYKKGDTFYSLSDYLLESLQNTCISLNDHKLWSITIGYQTMQEFHKD